MTNEIITYVLGAIIVGTIFSITRHIINTDKHPCKKDIVYKDVCDTKHKGLDDCIEGKINSLDQKFEIMREDMKEGFRDVKQLIKNGH